jgi:hypothetical protein
MVRYFHSITITIVFGNYPRMMTIQLQQAHAFIFSSAWNCFYLASRIQIQNQVQSRRLRIGSVKNSVIIIFAAHFHNSRKIRNGGLRARLHLHCI